MKNTNTTNGFWEKCKTILGNEFDAFYDAQMSSLPKIFRVNTLRNSVEGFLQWAHAEHSDWEIHPHIFGTGIFSIDRKNREKPLGKSFGHMQGRLYMQEASSCLPPLALDIQSGQKVLDMAAAPGSKTTQIAALMKNTGMLVVNEFSATRAKTLVFNMQKAGVHNALLTHFSGEKFGNLFPEYFDRILLDAPCTGEGTARKDKEALTHWSEKKILAAAKLQKSLLLSAFHALKPGGKLTYSTCTLGPEENEAVITFLQEQFPNTVVVLDLRNIFPGAEKCEGIREYGGRKFPDGRKMLRIWPHIFNSEGFFVATIQKISSLQEEISSHRKKKKRFVLHGKNKRLNPGELLRHKEKTTEYVRAYFQKSFGYELPKNRFFFRRNADIWILPEGTEDILDNARYERLGVRLGKIISDRKKGDIFRLSQEATLSFGQYFSGKNVLDISYKAAQEFVEGKNISAPKIETKGDVVVRYNGLPLGIGKRMGDVIKNNIPRNFLLEGAY